MSSDLVRRSRFYAHAYQYLYNLNYRYSLVDWKKFVVFRIFQMGFAWPVWTLRWIWVVLGSIGNPAGRWKRQFAYVQRFWRWYFLTRHCSFYTSRDLGKSSNGRLVLAVRRHHLDGLFLLQAFDVPVVVPVPTSVSQFRLVRGVRFPNLYRQLKPVRLDDLGTDAQAANIQRLMDRGYTVLAFINERNSHPKLDQELEFETQVISLIRNAPEVVLVNHVEFYEYPTASPTLPLTVRIQVCPLAEVLSVAGRSDDFVADRIAEYFGYGEGRIIRRG